MTVLITICVVLCIAALVYVIIAGYGGLFRLVGSLMRLAGYAEALHNSPHERQSADDSIPISLIMPDTDSDPDPVRTVKSLLALDYPEYEVIAVCNGENSKSMAKLVKAYEMMPVRQPIRKVLEMEEIRAVYRSPLQPSLLVLDKAGTLRSDALNAGVNVARFPLFVTLSAGYTLAKTALEQIAAPFMKNHRVVALGGLPRAGDAKKPPRGALAYLQQAEYLRVYPADFAIPETNRLRLIPGAYGAFRKQTVLNEGGFTPKCEETEMVAKLHRKLTDGGQAHNIDLLPEPVSRNTASHKAVGFFPQRKRWQAALVSALWRNKGMTLNPKYGKAGTLDMPYYWFFEVLGPILEVLGCILVPVAFALGWINATLFWAFWATEILLGIVVSLAALMTQELIDSDRPSLPRLGKLVLAAILGNIGYRQILLVFRLLGMLLPKKLKA